MEIQLQIYLIIGIVAFLLALLFFGFSIMAFYLIKLYSEVTNETKEKSYLRNHTFNNPTMDLDDELSRRYTMHTLERNNLETFKDDDKRKGKSNDKESTKSHNVAKSSQSGSVIDVSEQFIMKRQPNENSRYNSSIVMQVEDRRSTNTSVHELRTAFNNDTF